jgi:ABC-type Fe3+ transport system permease subunit
MSVWMLLRELYPPWRTCFLLAAMCPILIPTWTVALAWRPLCCEWCVVNVEWPELVVTGAVSVIIIGNEIAAC